jgi:ribosome-binding protein aMBF1 (putative translation factor)
MPVMHKLNDSSEHIAITPQGPVRRKRQNVALKCYGVREIRALRGLSLQQLAARSGVQIRTIHEVERYRIDPRLSTLRKLARALGVDIALLCVQPETTIPASNEAGMGGSGAIRGSGNTSSAASDPCPL